MKNLILFLFILFSTNIFAQNSIEDKEIIESFLNELLKKDFEKYKKIKIIPRFKNSKDFSFTEIISFKKEIEESNKGLYSFPYQLLHGKNLKERFKNDQNLMITIYDLVSNFNNHPKIKIKKLNLKKNVKITSDSYSFLSNLLNNNDINVLRRVKFSKIQHNSNYAVFYCSYSCGDLCGFGGFIFMEKINNKWTYLGVLELWVS